MSVLSATVEGIGFWYNRLPSWAAACRFVAGAAPQSASACPTSQLLAANERRRASNTVAVSLEVALAACIDAEYDPAQLPSVFTSTYGDQEIADYMSKRWPRSRLPYRQPSSTIPYITPLPRIGPLVHMP